VSALTNVRVREPANVSHSRGNAERISDRSTSQADTQARGLARLHAVCIFFTATDTATGAFQDVADVRERRTRLYAGRYQAVNQATTVSSLQHR